MSAADSDSDCDWFAGTVAGDVAVEAAVPIPPVAAGNALVGAAPPTPPADADALALAQLAGKRVCALSLPAPRQRAPNEHNLVAALMRERRAKILDVRRRSKDLETMQKAVELVSHDFSRGDVSLKTARRGSGLKCRQRLVIIATKRSGREVHHAMPVSRVLDVGFNHIIDHTKLASVFDLSDTHVRRLRRAIAQAIRTKEESFLTAPSLRAWMRRAPQERCATFCRSSIAFDETGQKMKVPI